MGLQRPLGASNWDSGHRVLGVLRVFQRRFKFFLVGGRGVGLSRGVKGIVARGLRNEDQRSQRGECSWGWVLRLDDPSEVKTSQVVSV